MALQRALQQCRPSQWQQQQPTVRSLCCSAASAQQAVGLHKQAARRVSLTCYSTNPPQRRRLFEPGPGGTTEDAHRPGPVELTTSLPPVGDVVANTGRRTHSVREDVGQQALASVQPWGTFSSPTTHIIHVFWDLDNKQPSDWGAVTLCIKDLQRRLCAGGQLVSMQAYANNTTLLRHDMDRGELEEMVEEVMEEFQEELRCPLCGQRMKSSEHLDKHWKQLHAREHSKRARAPPKIAKKYLASDKANRYRAAAGMVGEGPTRSSNKRMGQRGRKLKQLLSKLGVKLRDAPTQDQAADKKLVKDAKEVLALSEAQPLRWTPPEGVDVVLLSQLLLRKDLSANPAGMPPKLKPVAEQAEAHWRTTPAIPMQRMLLVISGDSGFKGLLQAARAKGWATGMVCEERELHKFAEVADTWMDWGQVDFARRS